MTVEVALVISFISVMGSLLFWFTTCKRNNNKDVSSNSYAKARTDVLLENISADVRDIKAEQKTFTSDMRNLDKRVIVVEQSCKSAHHRIDKLEGVESNE